VARPATGTLDVVSLKDGTRAFHLRFPVNGRRERVILHEAPGCTCGCGGGWDEPRAREELGNQLARVRLGIWKPPTPLPTRVQSDTKPDMPTFHEYASWWLQAKIDGVIGKTGGVSKSTSDGHHGRLQLHLLPFFGPYPLDQIDTELCLAFKAHKLSEARELREAIENGADIRDKRNRRVRPLSLSTIRRLIDVLAAILDEAIEDKHIPTNPARSKRMHIQVPKPRRTFLEMDELAALLDAASRQDRTIDPHKIHRDIGPTTRLVGHLLAQGKRPNQIARQLYITKATVSWHLRRLGATVGRGYVGRRAVCAILGYGGPRVTELCNLRIGHLRLHDPAGAHFNIPDSKTETGIREVQMSPDLVEVVIDHIDRLRRAGHPTGPDDHLLQNLRGRRLTRKRVGRLIAEAATAATDQLAAKGLAPLPHTTPHTLRRTYISIALLANNFDVKWVMGQVGHADSKMTMDVYAQLEQRADRSHGTNFDRLMREAQRQLNVLAAAATAPNDSLAARS
jgi:integrase